MKKRVLVLSSFPAPYRVAVFKGLASYYDMDLFFGLSTNESRNTDWYSKSDTFSFEVLDNKKSKELFNHALKCINSYDFVLAYDINQIPAFRLVYCCQKNNVPYFVNCDGAFLHNNPIKNYVKKLLFKKATGCFSSGTSATKYFLKYGVSLDRIFKHNFSSLEKKDIISAPLTKDEKDDIKRQLGIPNKKTAIAVGQFIKRKGFDSLLLAWSLLKNRDSQLIIVGGGKERAKYEKIIKKNKLSNVILIDYLPKDELKKYYLASDFFVLPTHEDVWGLVVNEAMACGLPVITTNKCNAGIELVQNCINGYIVLDGDLSDLAIRIDYLFKNEKLALEMSKNNLNLIKEYTIENIVLAHHRVIDKLI